MKYIDENERYLFPKKAFCIENSRYIAKLAETEEEVQSVLRLRFEVFNLEMNEGNDSSYETEVDVDEYDSFCYHIVVIDKQSEDVIGTYRIQTFEMAVKGKGFYSSNEYFLESLGHDILSQSVELGRNCIRKDHRNQIVFVFVMEDYLFGCKRIQ
ncbi:MAG: GNAT family N-acetyltransferase [Bacteroidales bacterium]|nr:GNAT family N-acetyltransferase [Bacteroidales bacterium]